MGHYQDLLAWDQTYGNELGMGLTYYNMGVVYQAHMKQSENAKYCFANALATFKKIGHKEYTQMLEKTLFSNDGANHPQQ